MINFHISYLLRTIVIGIFITLIPGICLAIPIFNPTTGHMYETVSSGVDGSWNNAENNAIALGGHLVTVNDAAEETWLRNNFGTGLFWIGFNDAASEGNWVWSSGETPVYTNWLPGEPNNAMPPPVGEDFAVMNWSGFGWNDWDHMRPDFPSFGPFDGIAEYTASVVPEPATVIILGSGLAGLFVFRKKRKI